MHKEFDSHRLNELGAVRVTAVRNHFDKLLTELDQLCPVSREFSLTRTKLEEASFFAIKAIANSTENQE